MKQRVRIPTLRLRHCLAAWLLLGVGFLVPLSSRIGDNDVWWHLKTGELISRNMSLPEFDPFSYTCSGERWINHEWLSEILMYQIFARSGLPGIVVMQAILIAATIGCLYMLVSRRLRNPAAAVGLTALCATAGWQSWSPRPQLFTFLLLTVLLLLLDKLASSRRLWWAVPLFALWSNLHGAWIFGFVVMAITLADRAIFASDNAARERRNLIMVIFCSLAAVLLGPYPLERLAYPIQYFTGSIPTEYVSEFQSPTFREVGCMPYEALVLALPVVLFLGRRPMRLSEWVLVLATLHLSLLSVRHTALFGIVSAPVFAAQVQSFLERRSAEAAPGTVAAELSESGMLNLTLLVALAVLIWAKMPLSHDDALLVEKGAFPVRAARFLAEHPRVGEGRLLNHYDWGGYLIFSLYPKYRVSIDGRADIHRHHMVQDHKAFYELSTDWKKAIRKLDPDLVIWPADEPLAAVLRCDSDWRLLYEDKTSAIFIPTR